jgi:hypothetical protein
MSLASRKPQVVDDAVAIVRLLILAGIPLGVLLGGVGGRLAMALLVQTSPDSVRGLRSDDDFIIGQFTIGGSYNLLMAASAAGFIGAAFYLWIVPYLKGSNLVRDITVAAVSAVFVGALVVSGDGVDFVVLEPSWLAVALFIAIPAVFGLLIGPVVRSIERSDSWVNQPRYRYLPVALVALFPLVLFVVVPAAVITLAWCAVRANRLIADNREHRLYRVPGGLAWVIVLGLSIVNLAEDFDAIF